MATLSPGKKKKNGTLIDCFITAVIRRDANDAVIGIQGAVKDITRMKPHPEDADEWKDVRDKLKYLER